MTRLRGWKTRHTFSLLTLAAFTAALIAVRAGWLPPILNSGRHFGRNIAFASNRDHLFIFFSISAQGTPRVTCFPRSLNYWQLTNFIDLTNELIYARDRRHSFAESVDANDLRLLPALDDVRMADSALSQILRFACGMPIPSNPTRFGLALGEFRTTTHASHVAYVSWYWIYAILSAAPALVLSLASIRRLRSRPSPGHCPRCGYDLTANESGKCPECGTPR